MRRPGDGSTIHQLHRTFKALVVGTYIKPKKTLLQLLQYPSKKNKKCGVVYKINCQGWKEGEVCNALTLVKQQGYLMLELQRWHNTDPQRETSPSYFHEDREIGWQRR